MGVAINRGLWHLMMQTSYSCIAEMYELEFNPQLMQGLEKIKVKY